MSTPASSPPAARPARRSNADYRWTSAKVAAFLRALGRCGSVAEAAREVGMSRQAAYRLRARLPDPRFQALFEQARGTGQVVRAEQRRAARAARAASAWGPPGLAGFEEFRAGGSAAHGDGSRRQDDVPSPQGDGALPQGDRYARLSARLAALRGEPALQGDGFAPQGDGSARKVSQ